MEASNCAVDIIKKHAPEILMISGLGCGIAATGYALYKGKDVTSAVTKYKNNVKGKVSAANDVIEEYKQDADVKAAVSKEMGKDILKDTGILAKEIIKETHPIIIFEAACVGMCVWSNRLQAAQIDKLTRDLAGVTAAYGILATAYNKYRDNVRTKYGVEEDELMRNGVIIEDEKGNKKVVLPSELNEEQKAKWQQECKNGNAVNGWDVIWDQTAGPVYPVKRSEELYSYEPDYKKAWVILNTIQNDIRKELRRPGGTVVVNDIYKKLGYNKFCSQAGQVTGWWNDTGRWLTDEELNKLFYMGLDSHLNYAARKGDEEGWWIQLEPMGVVLDHINCVG